MSVLIMVAEMAGLAPSGGAERGMLHLDDEMTGLIEAADTPAGQDGAHPTKAEPASPLPGQGRDVHSTCSACRSALPVCSIAPLSFVLLLLMSVCSIGHDFSLLSVTTSCPTQDVDQCTYCTACAAVLMQPLTLAAEESDVGQSWPGLFWLPPADKQAGERDMLHLDDELAGLVEAADTSADQDKMHPMKQPQAAASMPGEDSLAHRSLLWPSAIPALPPCAHLAYCYIAKSCYCSFQRCALL